MKRVIIFIVVVMILCAETVDAQRGCCSHHGGVAGCSSSGRTICNDGTYSPTCTCTPPKVYGCTDSDATNYNPNADIDDGSCKYEEKEVIKEPIYIQDIEKDSEKEELEQDEDISAIDTIIGLGLIGGGVYGYKKYKNNKKSKTLML